MTEHGVWFKTYADLPSDPAVGRLKRKLQTNTPTAVSIVVLLFAWAVKHARDGCLRQMDAEDIAGATEWTGDADELVDALISAGVLNDTRSIARWDEIFPFSSKKRAQDTERQRRHRAGRKEAVVTRDSVTVTRDRHAVTPLEQEQDQNSESKILSEHRISRSGHAQGSELEVTSGSLVAVGSGHLAGMSIELHRTAGASDAGWAGWRAQPGTCADPGNLSVPGLDAGKQRGPAERGSGERAEEPNTRDLTEPSGADIDAFIDACERGRTTPLSSATRDEVRRLARGLNMRDEADRVHEWRQCTPHLFKDAAVISWLKRSHQRHQRDGSTASTGHAEPSFSTLDPAMGRSVLQVDKETRKRCQWCHRPQAAPHYSPDGVKVWTCPPCSELPHCEAPLAEGEVSHPIQDFQSPDGFTWEPIDLARETLADYGYAMCGKCAISKCGRWEGSSDNVSEYGGTDEEPDRPWDYEADRPDPRPRVHVPIDDEDEAY